MENGILTTYQLQLLSYFYCVICIYRNHMPVKNKGLLLCKSDSVLQKSSFNVNFHKPLRWYVVCCLQERS